ncbi:hypothetical protein H671_6g17008 [Cricetulus griseus]|nr:hypothetical protein H671_6g17008 [Cricetulus griseus]
MLKRKDSKTQGVASILRNSSIIDSLALKENCFALLREECRHDVKSGALCVVHLKCFLIYITLIPSPLPPPHQPFQFSLEICVKRGGENICIKSEGARQVCQIWG